MRFVLAPIDVLANLAMCIVVASGLSLIVRPVTAELNATLGTVWPFSTIHCDVRTIPGCEGAQAAVGDRLGGRLHLATR